MINVKRQKSAERNSKRKSFLLASSAFVVMSGAHLPMSALAQDEDVAEEDVDDSDVIIVTSRKREQGLLDVPLAVSAIGQDDIEGAGIDSISDFFRRVPSLAVIDQGAARKNIIIRGIQTNTSTEDSVTDVYLDEQRITSAIATGDPRTFDMERIEILRGPQGTLFGGGSLAGTLRYITNKAKTSEFETNFAAGVSTTKGGDINYEFDGMINIPIVEDKIGFRAVGYYQDESGYLANSLLGFDDVAGIENYGFRFALRAQPTEDWTIDLKYTLQDLTQNGFPEARGVDVDALNQGGVTLTEERLTSKFQIYDLTWDYDFGWANLTSATGYLQFDFLRRNDNSLPLIRDFLGDDTLSAADAAAATPLRLFINDLNDNYTFTQEARLTSAPDAFGPLEWIAGFYYEDGEESVQVGDFLNPGGGALFGTAELNGAPVDFLFREDFVTELRQYALFGEVTYYLTDRFQATFGYRHSNFKSAFRADALIGDEDDGTGAPLRDILDVGPFTEKFNTFKGNLSYELSDDLLLFAQSAEGFRLGFGADVPPPLNPGCETFVTDFLTARGLEDFLVDGQIPGTTSDTLWSHEIGLKGLLPGGRGTFAIGGFWGDWKDILVEVEIDDITGTCNTGFNANAASATSLGIEAELVYDITDNFQVSGSGSYVDATIDNDEPFLGASAGERLPGSPNLQLSVTAEYHRPIFNGHEGFLRADVQYIGKILGAFEFDDPRTESGEYAIANLRAGVELDRFEITVFADNITNNLGQVFSNGLANEFQRTILLRPRTVGVEIRSKF